MMYNFHLTNPRDMLLSQECRDFHYILLGFRLIPITQTHHTQNTRQSTSNLTQVNDQQSHALPV